MIFSYGVRSIYIESCSLFVRGGVYRVVKEAMGGFLAKLSVSALMFDYILTGPISAVSAGQYIMGLLVDLVRCVDVNFLTAEGAQDLFTRWGSVAIAIAITLYFFRQNIIGIHESSDKALKIMIATTVMAAGDPRLVRSHAWVRGGPVNAVPIRPDLSPKVEYREVTKDDPLSGQKDVAMWVKDRHGKLVPEKSQGRAGPRDRQAQDQRRHRIARKIPWG